MTLQDTDQFLVNRLNSSYQVEAQNLMARIANDDLMLINRNGQSYNITGADVKASLGTGGGTLPDLGGIAVVLPQSPFAGETLTCVASGEGGLPPYSYTYQWFSNGGIIPGENASEYLIGASDVGIVFKCEVTITDDNGGVFVIMSNETNPSQNVAEPPDINTITLAETTPGAAPRFTDQAFVATVDMANEGQPVAVKTFNAYVYGRISTRNQFVEPLESHNTVTEQFSAEFDENIKGNTPTSSGLEKVFTNPPDQGCVYNAGTGTVPLTVTWFVKGNPDWASGNSCFAFSHRMLNGNSQNFDAYGKDPNGNVAVLNVVQNRGNDPDNNLSNTYVSQAILPVGWTLSEVHFRTGVSSKQAKCEVFKMYRFNDPNFRDGDLPEENRLTNRSSTNLVFASNADMTYLAAGDQVTQNAVNGTVASIADKTVTLTQGVDGWVNGQDVYGTEKVNVIDDAVKHLKFDSDGNVTDLLDAPQNPPYDTAEENPSLTLTFPSTFPSGQAPDDEIGDGATLTVEVSAKNLVGLSGPKSSTVQPSTTFTTEGIRDMTAEELAEQKLKFGTYNNRAAVYAGELAMVQREALLKELQEKGLDAAELLKTKAKRGRRKKAD